MMSQFVLGRSAFMNGLLKRIQDKFGACRAACSPTYDPAGEHIDHEGDVDEPLPHHTICEFADLSPGKGYLRLHKRKLHFAQVHVIYGSPKAFFI
jgi:hypothetical protein